jgi:hypothetical protein
MTAAVGGERAWNVTLNKCGQRRGDLDRLLFFIRSPSASSVTISPRSGAAVRYGVVWGSRKPFRGSEPVFRIGSLQCCSRLALVTVHRPVWDEIVRQDVSVRQQRLGRLPAIQVHRVSVAHAQCNMRHTAVAQPIGVAWQLLSGWGGGMDPIELIVTALAQIGNRNTQHNVFPGPSVGLTPPNAAGETGRSGSGPDDLAEGCPGWPDDAGFT